MLPRVKRVLVLGLAIGLAGALVSLVPWVLRLEETAGLDWLFLMRGPLPAPDRVAVVSIDAESAAAFGLPPKTDRWPRSLHARLVRRLAAAGAAVVAFDIMFDQPRDEADDRAFAEALGEAGNVVLLERLRTDSVPGAGGPIVVDTRVPPLPELKARALASAPFPLPVVPIKVSQFWSFGRGAGDTPTLPSVVLQAYLRRDTEHLMALLDTLRPGLRGELAGKASAAQGGIEVLAHELRSAFERDPALGDDLRRALAVESRDSLAEHEGLEALIALYAGPSSHYLNYYGPQRSLLTVPYHRVLNDPEYARSQLAGKVVFVGFSETHQPEQQDAFYSVFSETTGLNLPGVEIGATAFANLLDRSSIWPLPRAADLLLLLVWGVAIAAAVVLPPSWWALAGAGAAAPLYLGLAVHEFGERGLWLPLAVPLLFQTPLALFGAVGWNYARARAQVDRIRRALGYYLPPKLVERLARETVETNTELLHGTCLVTDAEQYTALSETLSPAALHELLNAYYRVLVGNVQQREGFVSDIVGDSMVAVWASAAPRAELRRAACETALAILGDVEAFNEAQGHRGLPTRIGLHCGQVLLGNIGAESHFAYRAVGDIVNTAARLQSLNKRLGTRVLASEAALAGLDGFAARELGAFRLAGKREPLTVFELVSPTASVDESGRRSGAFAAGLEAFREGHWTAAAAAFEALLGRAPNDGPARFYAGLSRRNAEERARPAPFVDLAEK